METIYFAQVREDAEIERTLQQNYGLKRITVIGSGGCTALSLVNNEVERVFCVDSNAAQCALIELKIAAMSCLDYEDFLSFIGEWFSLRENRVDVYQKVANRLSPSARSFWEAEAGKAAIAKGINQCGATERFYKFISQNLINVLGENFFNALLTCLSIEEQIQYYQTHMVNNEQWNTAIQILLSKTSHLQFFPAFMFQKSHENDYAQFFKDQFINTLSSQKLTNNYFLRQFLFSKYDLNIEGATPHYLSREGYAQAKANIHKASVVNDGIGPFLHKQTNVDGFFLSNVFDWCQEDMLNDICQSIRHSASPRAVLLYRNMLSQTHLPNWFMEQFREHSELSEVCMKKERSMMYQKITVGELLCTL